MVGPPFPRIAPRIRPLFGCSATGLSRSSTVYKGQCRMSTVPHQGISSVGDRGATWAKTKGRGDGWPSNPGTDVCVR